MTSTSTPAADERGSARGAIAGPARWQRRREGDPCRLSMALGLRSAWSKSLMVMSPTQLARLDDEELLDAVLVQELARGVVRDAGRHGDELFRHQRAHRLIEVLLEADVARGEDADRVVALDDRHAADVVLAHDRRAPRAATGSAAP